MTKVNHIGNAKKHTHNNIANGQRNDQCFLNQTNFSAIIETKMYQSHCREEEELLPVKCREQSRNIRYHRQRKDYQVQDEENDSFVVGKLYQPSVEEGGSRLKQI